MILVWVFFYTNNLESKFKISWQVFFNNVKLNDSNKKNEYDFNDWDPNKIGCCFINNLKVSLFIFFVHFIQFELSLSDIKHYLRIIVTLFEIILFKNLFRNFDIVTIIVHNPELMVRFIFDIDRTNLSVGCCVYSETYFVHYVLI